MAELLLCPPNSKIKQGRQDCPRRRRAPRSHGHSRSTASTRTTGENPRIDTYEVDIDGCGPMVLDALIQIKNEIDPTLTFRRSCREGICGSCAMNIDGINTLACTKRMRRRQGRRQDLPAAAHAGGQGPRAGPHATSTPSTPRSSRGCRADPRRLRRASGCSRRRTARSSTASTSASCAPAARPRARATGGTATATSARPSLLQAYRWMIDSRDEATGERLDELEDPFRLYRCHTIMNCTKACPKGLNPAKAIAEIKKMMIERTI